MVKRVSIFLLLVINLYAKDIEYSFHLSNKSPYIKEATILDVNLTQLDNSSVMFFKFSPKKSQDYIFKQIDFSEDEKYHALKQHYRYIIYPLKESRVDIEFDMIKSVTTDESVAYAISGDRDNIKTISTKDSRVDIAPILLNVKPLLKGTDLVGDFKLKYTIDKTKAKAYEPIYLHIELKGDGYLEPFEIIPQNKSYHIFKQKPKVTTDSIIWDYAISSKSDFVLPKVVLKAFNPKTKQSYILKIPSQKITVTKIEQNSIIDREDSPISSSDSNFSWLGWLLSYIVVFLSGFFMPRDIFKRFWFKRDRDEFIDRVMATKKHKELLKILLLEDSKKYQKAIEMLEGAVYSNKKVDLDSIKEEVLNER